MLKDANIIFNDWYAFEVCQAWELTFSPFPLSCYKMCALNSSDQTIIPND
jgi:hypothetical protein